MTDRQNRSNTMEIKGLIPTGKKNAVTNADLQQVMHVSRREISAAIHELRAEGMIICADTHGYYIPSTDQELIAGYDCLWKKAVNGLAALRAMRREIKSKNLYPLTAEYTSRKDGKNETRKENVFDEP